MSQVFSGDSVNLSSGVTVSMNTETAVVTGNFLNPPFGNAKAIVSGGVALTVGASVTQVTVRLRRNPSAENVALGSSGGVTVTAGNNVSLALQFADVIPDGRPCQYQLTVQQTGATGNGTANLGNVSAFLISG